MEKKKKKKKRKKTFHATPLSSALQREREREKREKRERERSAMEGRMSVCGRASLGQFSVARARAQSVKRLRSTDAGRTCHTHQSPEEDTFELGQQSEEKKSSGMKRRELFLASAGGLAALESVMTAEPSEAVQGLTAGRIPGLSAVDKEGFRTYARPEGKSGGHGVGWSEIPTYSFRVPEGWKEEPVSIADLGGTEIDVRFASKDEGQLAIVVAPVLRFMNVGFNADVRIEDIGPPEKVLNGFAPEILGGPVEDDDVLVQTTFTKQPLTYYVWETKKHELITATAFKNRVFIMAVKASGRQWRAAKESLHTMQKSFSVDTSSLSASVDTSSLSV